MSDENLGLDQNTPEVNDTPVDNTPDPIETKAREEGWVPKEEWEGEPDKWRPAKEFVDRGELFSKIDNVSKELKETRKALKMLQEHNQKLKETEYNRAVQELKAKQKEHLESGNADDYLEATELLTELKAEQKARQVVQEQIPANQPDPRFIAWVDKNSWYSRDQEMRDFADTIGLKHAQANPGRDPEEVLEYVEKQVRRAFSDKFQNPNRSKPSSVEGSGSQAAPSKKSDFKLTDEETKVMNTFLRTGAMTKEQYIEQVKSMRGAN